MPLSALERVEATFITAAKMLNRGGAGEIEKNRETVLPSRSQSFEFRNPGDSGAGVFYINNRVCTFI